MRNILRIVTEFQHYQLIVFYVISKTLIIIVNYATLYVLIIYYTTLEISISYFLIHYR